MSDRPATLRDVATAAGVHPATASRALNPGTRLLVSEETARRVSEAAERLGYRPNPVARSLRTRRSHTDRRADPRPEQPAVPADRARHRGPARRARLRRADRQHRRRPGQGAAGLRPDAGQARRRVRAGDRDRGQPHPRRGGRGRPAGRADEPHRAGLPVLLGLGGQRAGRAGGGRAPGLARAHQDRAHRRPAGRLHRRRPAARLPRRHGRAQAARSPTARSSTPPPTPWRRGCAAAASCSRATATSPRSSRATTCSRWAATARSTSSACAARRTCR